MKTNFFKKLKHGMFLLIAVLGTFISYAQSTPTIGGSRTPDTGGLLDIGGKQVPPITPLGIFAIEDDSNFAFLGHIGGKGTPSDIRQINDQNDFVIGSSGTNTNRGKIAASDNGRRKSSDVRLNQGKLKIDLGGKSTGGDTGGRSQDPTLHTIVPNESSAPTRMVYS
jgi:hypothetical protein